MKVFPDPNRAEDPSRADDLGMDLRDYFAAKAMQSFIYLDPTDSKQLSNPNRRQYRQWIAEDSYAMADAMMEARK